MYTLYEDLDAKCFILIYKDKEYVIDAKDILEAECKALELIRSL